MTVARWEVSMSKFFIALVAASVIGIPLAAQSADAQWWGYGNRGYYGGNVNQTQRQLQNQLTRGLASGRLTQKEYNRLLNQYNKIGTAETRFRTSGNGLTARERFVLQNRLGNLQNRTFRNLYDRQGTHSYRGWGHFLNRWF
jgi:hypothetical protein